MVGSGSAPVTSLNAVVAARAAAGTRRAWEIVIPLAGRP
jgi:hypothetical protein